jgi:phage I-like protein
MGNGAEGWYVIQSEDGHCEILPAGKISRQMLQTKPQTWGPYASEADAIARRVGLIRAGKCQPS